MRLWAILLLALLLQACGKEQTPKTKVDVVDMPQPEYVEGDETDSTIALRSDDLFSVEDDAPDIKPDANLNELPQSSTRLSVKRYRFARADSSALLSGDKRVKVNFFDDAVFEVELSGLTYRKGAGRHRWEGDIPTNQFESPDCIELFVEGMLGKAIETRPPGMSLTLREQRLTKETGETVPISSLQRDPIVAADGGPDGEKTLFGPEEEKLDPKLYEKTYVFSGVARVGNTLYTSQPLRGETGLQIIAEMQATCIASFANDT